MFWQSIFKGQVGGWVPRSAARSDCAKFSDWLMMREQGISLFCPCLQEPGALTLGHQIVNIFHLRRGEVHLQRKRLREFASGSLLVRADDMGAGAKSYLRSGLIGSFSFTMRDGYSHLFQGWKCLVSDCGWRVILFISFYLKVYPY